MAQISEPGVSPSEFFNMGSYTNEVNPDDPYNTVVNPPAEQIQDTRLQQKIANGITKAAAKANEQMNEMLSAMLQPIYDAIQEFKGVPPKIRSLVDVDGAANGMYKQLGKVQARMFRTEKKMISSEVPIELQDYLEDPSAYENLMALEYQKNTITEEDCLSSGYTKIKWQEIEVKTIENVDQYPPPQDRDIVGKQMEKLVGSTIKHAWQVVKPPIQTIASIANIGPIPEMIQSIIDAVDAIVKIASKVIPEEKLDEMLAQKLYAQEQAQAEADKATKKKEHHRKSLSDRLANAMDEAQSAISQTYNGIVAGVSESFANFEAPTIPDDVKETIEDFKDALIMVKDNISNIYIVILLKMMEAVFKCFNQILGVIGVPSIPDPLGKIPQILTDAMNIMKFVMGLPMSLIQCLTAIIKRKMKAVQIALIPTPPMPLPPKKPLPPTSKDVVKPEETWDDVKALLTDKYLFSSSDADEIISKIQEFYDGSGEEVQIVMRVTMPESAVKKGDFDQLPVFDTAKRYKMEPPYCKDTWIPSRIERNEAVGEGYYYFIKPPVRIKDTYYSNSFYIWTSEKEKTTFDHENDWSMLKDYMSSLEPEVKPSLEQALEPGGNQSSGSDQSAGSDIGAQLDF